MTARESRSRRARRCSSRSSRRATRAPAWGLYLAREFCVTNRADLTYASRREVDGSSRDGFLLRFGLGSTRRCKPAWLSRYDPGPMSEPHAFGSHATGIDRAESPAVLVVDDEADLRELLSLTLVRLGLDVDTAESVAAARSLLARNRYCAVPDRHAICPTAPVSNWCAKWLRSSGPPIAVITAYGSAENAVAALKAGAFDYLTKPVDLDQLRLLVRSGGARCRPGASCQRRAAQTAEPVPALARLVGTTPAMQQMRALIERLARSMAPVAICGESGSGKELAARAIHELSARRAQPFVAVNCGAIPETLMEAEFFGYRKGAFTGADRDRDGFFQAAAGGTLFLDEVAESAAGDAGQAAARDPGTACPQGRISGGGIGRRAARQCHAPGSRGAGGGRALPPGSVLSTQCHRTQSAAAARATGRHRDACEMRSSRASRSGPVVPSRDCRPRR